MAHRNSSIENKWPQKICIAFNYNRWLLVGCWTFSIFLQIRALLSDPPVPVCASNGNAYVWVIFMWAVNPRGLEARMWRLLNQNVRRKLQSLYASARKRVRMFVASNNVTCGNQSFHWTAPNDDKLI